MIQFILPNLFIYSTAVQFVAPPKLPDDMAEWIESSNITQWRLLWVMSDVDLKPSYLVIWDTAIQFVNDSDAVLFKLRWL